MKPQRLHLWFTADYTLSLSLSPPNMIHDYHIREKNRHSRTLQVTLSVMFRLEIIRGTDN